MIIRGHASLDYGRENTSNTYRIATTKFRFHICSLASEIEIPAIEYPRNMNFRDRYLCYYDELKIASGGDEHGWPYMKYVT